MMPDLSPQEDFVVAASEMLEDFYLSKIAEALDKKGAITYKHADAWK